MKMKSLKFNMILTLIFLFAVSNSAKADFWQTADSNNTVKTDSYGQTVISDYNSAKLRKEQKNKDLIYQKQKDYKSASKEEKKQIQEDLDNINSYSNHLFISFEKQRVDDRIKYQESMSQLPVEVEQTNNRFSTPPIKRLRLKISNWRNRKNAMELKPSTPVVKDEPKNQAILDCDLMRYFNDKSLLEADGHAVLRFPSNNTTLKADVITYNQAAHIIQAKGNVVMIKDGREVTGEIMNEENAFMINPSSQEFELLSHAKKGYVYGDKIVQEDGNLTVNKHHQIQLRSDFFGPDLTQMMIADKDKSFYVKDSHGKAFRIDTQYLIINSSKEHNTITLKHAQFFVAGKKVCTIPSFTIHTNKNMDYVEANYPEFGTMMNLGSYIGPGFDFDTPHGTNLKVIPIFNYHKAKEGTNDHDFGFGGIAKFKSATNYTDAAFGTTQKIFILRGKQRLDDHLYLQYGANSFQDDWFLGYRMPKIGVELIYADNYPIANLMGKGLDFNYSQRISAGYMQDNLGEPKSIFADGAGIGTTRFKYMAEAAQTLYNYTDEDNLFKLSFSIVGQGSFAEYGTGTSQAIARIGPNLHTQYKYWMQDIGYFLSGYNDESPFVYDKYVYGRSNVYARESLRVSKFVTLSWFVSMNMTNDSWNGKFLQENSFFVSFGPDDIKVNLGYDTIRKQTYLNLALNIDAKGAQINYKKMVLKNPDKLGGEKDKDVEEAKSFTAADDDSERPIERAEVIDIDPHADEE